MNVIMLLKPKDTVKYIYDNYTLRQGLEKYGFIEENIGMQERYERRTCHFDMSKYFDKLIDVQAIIFDSDTNIPYPNLKGSEEYYLGWRGASFKDTLGSAENFYHLRPNECYIYAATDALGTYLLAQRMWIFYEEPGQRTRYPKAKFPQLTSEKSPPFEIS